MLIGRYYHTLEEKGRVSLPKNFRQETEQWIVTRGLDGGLYVFPAATFETELAKLASRTFTKKRDRDFVRYMANDAYQLEVDSQGRVLLPEYLRSFAKLEKNVVVIGSYSYLEIWDVQAYHEYVDQIENTAESIAESIEINDER